MGLDCSQPAGRFDQRYGPGSVVSHFSFFNDASGTISVKTRHLPLAISMAAIWGVNVSHG